MFQVVNWAALSLAENLRHIQEGPHGEIDDSNRAALEVKKKRDHKIYSELNFFSNFKFLFFLRNGKLMLVMSRVRPGDLASSMNM